MSNAERNLITRIPRQVRYAGYSVLTLAAGLAVTACGGSAKANYENPTQIPTQPIATAKVEPTATVMPTPEPLPKVEDVAQKITSGFAGINVTFEQISNDNYRNSADLLQMLNNCNQYGQPIKVFGFPETVEPTNPNYRTIVLGQCAKVGEATKLLFQITGKKEFLEANQMVKRLHLARVEDFRKANPTWDPTDYWSVVESRSYISPSK